MARGTNVTSATSFVMNIDEKKHSSTSTKDSCIVFLVKPVSIRHISSNTPIALSPSITSISPKRIPSTWKSINPAYSAFGGFRNEDIRANRKAIKSTVSFLINKVILLIAVFN